MRMNSLGVGVDFFAGVEERLAPEIEIWRDVEYQKERDPNGLGSSHFFKRKRWRVALVRADGRRSGILLGCRQRRPAW